jgi:protocatechuate 3,4-dioxygenase beta subunit
MMVAKSVLTAFLITLAISGFSLASVTSGQSSFKVSGYILDSNGHGIGGANIIFNVPDIVPSVSSNSSGYYVITAPAGTYHINVWPPFDSNFIDYDQPGFVVGSDTTKNITLPSGFKVSGYISDSSGAPVTGAVVLLNNFGSGWFSNYMGYYFLSVPAGTYTINAHPRTGYNYSSPTTDFPTYYEYNFAVNSNTIKNITVGSTVSTSNKTKISGYVSDANGKGLSGAEIIFGVPNIVPSVYTNYSGYYAIYAPADTYHLDVWPPFDSNYLSYDQQAFSVGSSDIIKNITLGSGYKLSGYLTDSRGAPIRGALASLNQFYCGWYSNNTGYYFVTAPAGTYTLTIQPKTGPIFPTYTENNFPLTHNTVRNFTLTTSANTPATTNNLTSNPKPTSTLSLALLSITAEAKTLQVGSTVNVNGKLSDQNGNPLVDKTVILSYALNGGSSWFQIGSGKTNASGEYSIQWVVGASGTFTLKAEWAGDTSYSGAGNSTTLSFLPYQNRQVFYVESNSTVSALAFNSASSELSFVVSGPNGTEGYVKATIAKSLVSNAENIKVYLDGNQLDYEVISNADSWLLSFNYMHSTHQVSINLAVNASGTTLPGIAYWTLIVAAIIITTIGTSLLVHFKKRKITP